MTILSQIGPVAQLPVHLFMNQVNVLLDWLTVLCFPELVTLSIAKHSKVVLLVLTFTYQCLSRTVAHACQFSLLC